MISIDYGPNTRKRVARSRSSLDWPNYDPLGYLFIKLESIISIVYRSDR